MYFKLAFQNVKKSYKDFLIYFLTLTFSVCLFYTFNSFQAQQSVMQLKESQSTALMTMSTFMSVLSVFVAVVLAFLILYANNFLIRRRKKEFGLYMLLGMPKSKISRILIYETFIIGLVALITGMILGFMLSQVLTLLTASLFAVKVNYHFVFSMHATLLTVISFSVIFLVIMMFNNFVLNKYKLISLINAESQNENPKVRNLYLSVVIFILSLISIGSAYFMAMYSIQSFVVFLVPILLAGSLGTLLFFMSLSGFLLKFIQSSKRLYYKNLNMFVLRQINSKINTNFVSMSIVCVMLLLSIGALATGLNLNSTFNQNTVLQTPYDYSYNIPRNAITVSAMKKALAIDYDRYVENEDIINVFSSPGLSGQVLQPYIKTADKEMFYDQSLVDVLRLSEYNRLLKAYGHDEVSLKENEFCFATSLKPIKDILDYSLKDENVVLSVFGTEVVFSNTEVDIVNICTTMGNTTGIAIVVNDDVIPSSQAASTTCWNVDLRDGIESYEFSKLVDESIMEYRKKDPDSSSYLNTNRGVSRDEVVENGYGMGVLFTYIGIYLGIVFLMASAVILALQQLSEANDNRKRYLILGKIGAEKKMINKSIFQQIGIYFLMPLLLALVHSYVGIKVVTGAFSVAFGIGNILQSCLITAGVIILIYGSYFLVTYQGYKNILSQN